MTIWIGLTGGIGSGKSQAAAEFSLLGVPVIDADAVSRSLTTENGLALPAIRQTFGDDVFDASGSLNRAALRTRVFRSDHDKQGLESLLHPLIIAEIERQQQAEPAVTPYGVIDIPLLVEQPAFRRLVSRILVIDCAEEEQIRRVQLRSGLAKAEICQIIAAQASRRHRLQYADDVVGNHVGVAVLAEKLQRLHGYYQAVSVRKLKQEFC